MITGSERVISEIMNQIFQIQQFPIFPRGTFNTHQNLFVRFGENTSGHLKQKYEETWQGLTRFEETITWQMLTGPGICAATHPGADNVFVEIMVGINSYVYNSDCVYVNPSRKIFAVSDPPGITTGSRRIFEKLDGFIHQNSIKDNLQHTINRLNREMNPSEGATLSLLHFRKHIPHATQSFIAGDTFLFHGNLQDRTMQIIKGQDNFIGTPYAEFHPIEHLVKPGDFFLIASDGILSIKTDSTPGRLEDIMLNYLENDWRTFVPALMNAANAFYQEKIYDRTFSRFGGKDNISLLMVFPEELGEFETEKSYILGGYLEERG